MRCLSIGMAAVLAAGWVSAAALVNGGFETKGDGHADGWRAYQGYTLDTQGGRTGGSAIRCELKEEVKSSGVMQEIIYDTPTTEPVLFGGWSRNEASVYASDYCIYLDIWYEGGGNAWGVRADWNPAPHGWTQVDEVFFPAKPIKKIQYFVFIRNGSSGTVWFDDLYLERRTPELGIRKTSFVSDFPHTRDGYHAEINFWKQAEWQCVMTGTETGRREEFSGRGDTARFTFSGKGMPVKMEVTATAGNEKFTETLDVPLMSPPRNPVKEGVAIWCADSMRRVTPMTYPAPEDLKDTSITLELARNESESAQILVTAPLDSGHDNVTLELTAFTTADNRRFDGEVSWQRQGYILRRHPFNAHPEGVALNEIWMPDPLLPPAPFRVRPGATQGVWLTARATADTPAGEYHGRAVLRTDKHKLGEIKVLLKVYNFANPATFGMPTAFSVMDGFTRTQYPERFEEMKRKSHDLMLDHRLNPDDISRTDPPLISDLLHARERGMNRFNILNIVPRPQKPSRWVCYANLEVFTPEFDAGFKNRLVPYMAELRRHGLDKYAYVYGFDERGHEFYPAIGRLWRTLKAAFPELPVFTTAYMYRDMANGCTYPEQEITDWHCPLSSVYKPELSARLRTNGRQVWWYVCCGPTYPYANFASFEYPWIEGRLLGWMTHHYSVDGLLFWHVNYWPEAPALKTSDTFLPAWKADTGLRMPGDGQLLYPTEEGPVPCVRLVNVRDGIEDYEWLQMVAAKHGRQAADALSGALVRSMTDFDRSPAKLRATRTRMARLLEESERK